MTDRKLVHYSLNLMERHQFPLRILCELIEHLLHQYHLRQYLKQLHHLPDWRQCHLILRFFLSVFTNCIRMNIYRMILKSLELNKLNPIYQQTYLCLALQNSRGNKSFGQCFPKDFFRLGNTLIPYLITDSTSCGCSESNSIILTLPLFSNFLTCFVSFFLQFVKWSRPVYCTVSPL